MRASDVVETAPAAIAAALKGDRVSVVLFTSPDAKCGFCVGEDKAFDGFARAYGGDASFRRVQWSPWTAFPDMGVGARVRGVPMIFVFRDGQAVAVLKGRLGAEAPWLRAQIDRAMTGKRLPLFGNEKPSTGAAAATAATPSPTDMEVVRLAATSGLYEQSVTLCADLNVSLESRLSAALAQWRARRKPPAPAQAGAAIQRIGGTAANQIVLDLDRGLASQLSVNEASEAGCSALADLIGKS